MSPLILPSQNEHSNTARAKQFCEEFCGASSRQKFVLGRNIYAKSVVDQVGISGFIDDYTDDDAFLGLPVVKTEDVPKNALVLISSGGKPLSAKRRLDGLGLQSLDYFAFFKFSGLPLTSVVFNEGFAEEFQDNEAEYEWIYSLLHDETSRSIFKKLVSFRLKYELDLLSGFTSRESSQYFEDFLQLRPQGETFIDVGGFNGFNSLEFIRLCPGYDEIHIFEPEPDNYRASLESVGSYANVHCHQMGLSNSEGVLKLAAQGSGSKISDCGSTIITVGRLDDVLSDRNTPTFIKMDIEGSEIAAIEGSNNIIKTHHPRLALCIYHNVGDFWKIPKVVLSMRDDYTIYVRHYTESIYETVMFFIPK
ncbi:FkbM family methyltransferase [Nitrosovibrio tenuis]|uniref:Methyltransferase, FkbM family n=1 Tax=Nitrosovibrio tenuis TaxID=1233 RepID=A0A1H7GCZ1_9PROT|nr:FkbM family methyltransferase [Nitrosovibrio tenuis]SEK36001.1 methyltransferase, FkbM family [Nitrosovibrio tenuis]